MKNKKHTLLDSYAQPTPPPVPPIPEAPAKPQLIMCENCVYRVEIQCRLFPPTIQGGWATYPNVVGKNHGCFQGEVK